MATSAKVSSPANAPVTQKAPHAEVKPEEKAPETEAVEKVPPKIVNTTLIAEIDRTITVKLEDETMVNTEVHRTEKGALYVNAVPIFSALDDDFEYDAETKALIVRRSQDGVVMELYTDTGIVKADGKSLGKLRHFGEVGPDKFILTSNAISVLAGLRGRFDKEAKEFKFKLDPRLRVASGFEIFVNGVALGNLNPAPKSVGPVLVMPLLPIAEALGHDVQVIEGGESVRVRRAQDSAVFTLNLHTGLVKLRGKPYGISKNVTYIDQTNLLLPVSAIEALTGTHVKVVAGSNRIDITLDDRLTGAIEPTASVDETAKNTPFTPERLTFHLGPDTVNRVEAEFRQGRFNGRVRYEIPDLPTKVAEAQPSWLSLDFAHTSGVTGSIGDYAADYRELEGVGLRHIRGIAAVKHTKKARIAVAAGLPASGAKTISADQSRLTYSGVAVGGRYASKKGWEVGAAYKMDGLSNDQMAVLSAISGRLGRKKGKKLQWDARGSVGVFSGPVREKSVDMRITGTARYELSKSVTLDSFAQYDGAEFLRNVLDDEDRERDITETLDPDVTSEDDTALLPDTRLRGLDQASVGASIRVAPHSQTGLLANTAVALRLQQSRSGIITGKDLAVTQSSVGASVGTTLGNTGVSVSMDGTAYGVSYADGRPDETGRQFSARLHKRIKKATLRTQYVHTTKSGSAAHQTASATLSGGGYNLNLPKDAKLTVSPSATATWTSSQSTSLRGGVLANFQSGDMLGKKTRLDASFGVLQSFSGQAGASQKTDRFFTVSVGRQLRVGKNMMLGLAYRNNLSGDQRIGLQLDGRFDFNEKRRFKDTENGRGVLKGIAFHDQNRDGIKQESEPAVPGGVVRVKGTRLSLRTDRLGQFTIQNIKEGLYEVQVDGRSLPLGFAVSDHVPLRVTIQDGHITDIPLPIVQRGQIRGFAYEDANGDGEFTPGETRLEQVKLQLTTSDETDAPVTTYTTSFGQYAFDDLPAKAFTVSVIADEKNGIYPIKPQTIDLGAAKDLMVRLNIPVTRQSEILMAKQGGADPPDKQSADGKTPAPP